MVDEIAVEEEYVKLVDDKVEHFIVVEMGV